MCNGRLNGHHQFLKNFEQPHLQNAKRGQGRGFLSADLQILHRPTSRPELFFLSPAGFPELAMEDALQSNSFAPPSSAVLDEGFVGSWGRMKDPQEGCSFSSGQGQDLPANDGDPFEWVLCVPGSKVVTSGLNEISSRDVVLFVNAGGGVLDEGSSLRIGADSFFQGGDVLRTDERIVDAGSCPTTLYQSARFGNFSYTFDGLAPGRYFVDLHFAEIVYTNGPKGIRVFNVFVQEEKVLSEIDIYAVVGANKSLQIVDVGVTVSENGVICIKFEGVHGSPSVSGICIRKAHTTLAPLRKEEHLLCKKCTSAIEVSPTQSRVLNTKSTVRYEKKIEELQTLCKLKTDECYEAWMSLTDANEKLEKLGMELDTKFFQAETLDQTVRKQTDKLKDVSAKYEKDKKHWAAALNQLEAKIQAMKKEQAELSHDAHECTSSIPQLNEMVIGIQALGKMKTMLYKCVEYYLSDVYFSLVVSQCEDLKLKYRNIRVFCRCRPLSKEEVASGYATVIDFEGAKDGDLGLSVAGSTKRIFRFDRVYAPKDDQVNVFADASPLVTSVLDGYNVCIFAYGQTGTGKTFTMEGTEQNRGVNYRTLEELFKVAKERCETFSYNISVSVLEVYNEQIRDLLATSPSSKK
ncbi:hypothetical protein Taro_009071 [Colocasia esculenta]|uniref:Kinesin motor domain-containing protein n=1 Tax=Colocasia esculenta TaxID=4460 RepID=A0A843U8X1_COLES|nr:hypothetical protein [Colocasia esculenta]